MSVVFSGIQPTGKLHLGNYLGAIKPFREMILKDIKSKYFFCIVDLHAITVYQNPSELKRSSLELFATFLASGIEPSCNITLFKQSQVKEHAELAWILSCNTPLGWLDRMTQYKDKTKENKERQCLGLYAYPTLMAADILLYDASEVPVGDDQKQHLELTRDIALRMNSLYKKDLFIIPNPKIANVKRVMSLKDGTKKMSKSDTSDYSRINITDSPDEINKKIKKAVTGEVHSPEVKNLLTIYNALTGEDNELKENNFAKFKAELTDYLIAELKPITEKFHLLMKDPFELDRTLKKQCEIASEAAFKKMEQIKYEMGF